MSKKQGGESVKNKELSINQMKIVTFGGVGAAFIMMVCINLLMSAGDDKKTEDVSSVKEEEATIVLNEETTVIHQKDGVTEKTEEEIMNMKSEVWGLLEELNIDEASKKMLEIYKTVIFTEENELEKWHLDVSLVATAAMLDYNDRAEMLGSLTIPRFKTTFSVFASPLVVAELVLDKQSLIPVDVESFWIEKESYLSVEEFEKLNISSNVAKNLAEQTETFYVADILYDETKLKGVSAILNSGESVLIGYFSNKETPYETAQFWEENRSTFENISALN